MLEAAHPSRRDTARSVATTASIASIGTALPRRVVTSKEIAARIGVEPGWIEHRTGIRERRHAGPDESLTELATAAAERALAAAGVAGADLDLVLVATSSPDRTLPNAAPLVAGAIGAGSALACDIGAACTGFLSGLALATGHIESGRARHALVVGADFCSRFVDHRDRKTAGLFADGAGAAVISAGGAGAIEMIEMRSDASDAECLVLGPPDHLIRMRGQDTFRAAVDGLSGITEEVLAGSGLVIDDVDLFIYHQANARITAAVGERVGLPADRVVDCIETLGNTSAASLPLALSEAAADGRLQPGARLLLAAFGAGFLWGACLTTWGGEVG